MLHKEDHVLGKLNGKSLLTTYILDRSQKFAVALQTVRSLISASSSPLVAAPVSLLRRSTYVIFGRPLPRCPWVGSHCIRRCAPGVSDSDQLVEVFCLQVCHWVEEVWRTVSHLLLWYSSVHWGLFWPFRYWFRRVPFPLILLVSWPDIRIEVWTQFLRLQRISFWSLYSCWIFILWPCHW